VKQEATLNRKMSDLGKFCVTESIPNRLYERLKLGIKISKEIERKEVILKKIMME